jgi:AIPR protein
MSDNDVVALEANYKNWRQSNGRGLTKYDPFVFYSIDQFLKPFHVSDSDVAYGLTDGGNDGGVDGFYFFVNGELMREDSDVEARTAEKVNLILFQIKGEEGFKPTEIDKLQTATDDILNLSATTNPDKYKKQLVALIDSFKEKYQELSGNLPAVYIDYYYVTKGDELEPNALAESSITKVKQTALKHLSKAIVEFHCINVQGLLQQLQKRPVRKKTLNWAAVVQAPAGEAGYFGLVELPEYFGFITNENRELMKSYFDSNVRGFWRTSPQNKKIMESLETQKFDFWQSNNGITILSPCLGTQGFNRIVITDPQVVNGLQTSRCIFNYFTANQDKLTTDKRKLLVRVIETKEKAQQSAIIFATNNQNRMPASALRATDDIQLRIEDLFEQWGLYYDRRKGVHKDEGRPINNIVSIEEVIQAVVSIVLQRPKEARGRPGDYVKVDEKYSEAFSSDYPLTIFLKCVLLQQKVLQTSLRRRFRKKKAKVSAQGHNEADSARQPRAPVPT